MEGYTHDLIALVRVHQAWAAPLVLVLAFCESLAFISLLVPAWGILVAIGAMMGPGQVNFWPVWAAGAVGAALGDWLSYWLGFTFKDRIAAIWPLTRYPDL
ncbi:MAG TPA: DedA family protein, partial [Xanthobacteraceae bacterium]|nr:DedA family protein [Xanthobacteraceae bacterium]